MKRALALLAVPASMLAGCGGGHDVPRPHRVVRVTPRFPAHQVVSRTFAMELVVRAPDGRPLRDVSVTLVGSGPRAEALSQVITPESVPPGANRAIWVLERGPARARRPDSRTWLVRASGRRLALRFRVTPARPGLYAMHYRIVASGGAAVATGTLHTQITGAPLLHF